VFVLRVDNRSEAGKDAFEAQKAIQKANAVRVLQEARIREFMQGLRDGGNHQGPSQAAQRRCESAGAVRAGFRLQDKNKTPDDQSIVRRCSFPGA
jgi:hypothetical protein